MDVCGRGIVRLYHEHVRYIYEVFINILTREQEQEKHDMI